MERKLSKEIVLKAILELNEKGASVTNLSIRRITGGSPNLIGKIRDEIYQEFFPIYHFQIGFDS